MSLWVGLLHILLCLYCTLQCHTCCVFDNPIMPSDLCYSGDQLKPLQLIYPLSISIFKTKIRQKEKNNGCSNVLVSLPAFEVVTFFMLPIHHFLEGMTCILGSPTIKVRFCTVYLFQHSKFPES